jgi:hypothetical protein
MLIIAICLLIRQFHDTAQFSDSPTVSWKFSLVTASDMTTVFFHHFISYLQHGPLSILSGPYIFNQ